MNFTLKYLASLSAAQHAIAPQDTFDYIVVGAGASGVVIANRLSENPAVRVALIEAGDDVREDEIVRNIHSQAGVGSYIDWNYTTVPQVGVNGQSLLESGGKGWGGTTLINGMNYVRPHRQEVDAWEELGNPGWNWDNLFPYYQKSEGFIPPTASQVSAGATYQRSHHGFNGPVRVGYDSGVRQAATLELIQKGWHDVGLQQSPDFNSGDNNGFAIGPRTLDPEADMRWHSSRAYLEFAERRTNLVVVNGTVKKLDWQPRDPSHCRERLVANGVEYWDDSNQLVILHARHEVILSAGSFRSPGILEASGIGNPWILKDLGVQVRVNLPGVGENLSEQPCASVGFAAAVGSTPAPLITFTNAHQTFGGAFKKWEALTLSQISKWAKETVEAVGNDALNATAIEKLLRVQHSLLFHQDTTFGESVAVTSPDGGVAGSFYMIQSAFSRGNVHLRSQDDVNRPLINPRLYSNEFDISAMIALGNLTRRMWYSETLAPLIIAQVLPDESVLPVDASIAVWTEFLRATTVPNRHPLGTASMMSRGLGGVVDPELRVYGTANVRVVDGSIIPIQISGHPIATLYAVAERAVDIVKAASHDEFRQTC